MTKHTSPCPIRKRRAFHEAGHALVALQYEIEIQQVMLSWRPSSCRCYQPLADYCRLTPGKRVDLAKLDQYIVFLMAGSVTEMIAIERHHGIQPATARQTRFRAHWYQTAWLQPEWHLDLAYYCTAFWSASRVAWEIPKQLRLLWLRTCRLIQDHQRWADVENIAGALMDQKMLDAGQILAALDNSVAE